MLLIWQHRWWKMSEWEIFFGFSTRKNSSLSSRITRSKRPPQNEISLTRKTIKVSSSISVYLGQSLLNVIEFILPLAKRFPHPSHPDSLCSFEKISKLIFLSVEKLCVGLWGRIQRFWKVFWNDLMSRQDTRCPCRRTQRRSQWPWTVSILAQRLSQRICYHRTPYYSLTENYLEQAFQMWSDLPPCSAEFSWCPVLSLGNLLYGIWV